MKYPFNKWAKWRPGIIIPVFFLSQILPLHAQVYYPDARSIALGNIHSVSGIRDLPMGNPASLGTVKNIFFGAGHISPFLIGEIGISSLESVLPVNPGTFHIRITNYGLKGYRNFSWKAGYGMVLGEKLSGGVSFQYYNTMSNGEWNYLWAVGIEAGIIYQFSENTTIGLHILNPFTIGTYPDYGPLFPSELTAGISQIIYENIRLLAELSQFTSGNTQYKMGLEYMIGSALVLRSAYHSSPHSLSFGTGYRFGKFLVHTAFSWSVIPGFTPAIQIQYYP
jgi:hypothetical protein